MELARIVKIGIEVEDIEASLAFYHGICNMPILERFPQPDGGECIFLDAGSIILELMSPKTSEEHLHHIAFGVDDVTEAVRSFREQKVTISMEPVIVEENIHLADIRDADGMRVRLFHREV